MTTICVLLVEAKEREQEIHKEEKINKERKTEREKQKENVAK